ncbi:MAG: class I SAM-dependent methyltransferase, partial [Chloroflexota bacterium]
LAGYSTIWLARAVPEKGSVVTLEVEPAHARLAREHFKLAGLDGVIEIVEGSAHETLPMLARREPFDMMFIDAEKTGYPAYLAWALENLPSGALIVGHNAFRGGQLVSDDPDEAVLATRELLQTMARDERLLSTIIPVGDGFAVGMIQRGVGNP